MVDFADLIPSEKSGGDNSLAFDDLIPAESTSAPAPVFRPSTPAPNRSGVPVAPAPATSSRDANDLRPSSRDVDPFANESLLDTTKRRGQQAAAGATEAFAAVPEGAALLGVQADQSRRAGAEAGIAERRQAITDLEARLKDPSLRQSDRTFLESTLADLREGIARLEEQAAEPIVPARDRSLYKAGETIRQGSQEIFGKPDERDQSFWAKLAYGAGNVAGMGATAVGSAIVAGPAGALVVGGSQGALMNSSAIYKEAIAAGVDEETALEASNLGLLVGMSEILPLSRALKILGGGQASSTLMRKAIEIGKNAGEEGLQEFAAQVANNMIAQGYYDPERGTFQGGGEAFAIGAILGGATGMVGSAVAGGRDRDEDPRKPTVTTGETSPDAQAALKGAGTTAPTPPADTAVAPDAKVALDANVSAPTPKSIDDMVDQVMKPAAPAAPVTPPGNAPADAAPAAPVQETPAPGPEAAGDTVETVPEAPATIATQNQALLDPKNKRKAVFIPFSSYEAGEVDEPEGKTIGRVVLPDAGILFFNKAKGYTAADIRALYKAGKLGQVLGLGDITKADAAKSAAQGNPPVAVTERTPEGTEVKAAAGTTETAPDQVAALEATQTPGNTVQVESPAKVMADRLAGRQIDAAPAAPAPQATEQVAQPTEQVAPAPTQAGALADVLAGRQKEEPVAAAPEAAPEAAPAPAAPTAADKARSVRENAVRALAPQLETLGFTVDQVLAMPEGQQRRTIEKAKLAAKPVAPKAQVVKEVAKKREEAAKPAPKAETKREEAAKSAPKAETKVEEKTEAKPEVTPEVTAQADGTKTRVEVDPETGKRRVIISRPEVEAATEEFNRGVQRRLNQGNETAETDQRAEQRGTARSDIEEKVRTGEIKDSVAETDALIDAGGKNLTADEKAVLRKNAKIAGDLLEQYAPDEFQTISTMEEKKSLLERLTRIISEANERGFVWGRKGVGVYNSRAVTWLYDVRTFQRKLSGNIGKVVYKELNDFLADEVATKRGDARNMKDRRKEVGEQMSKPSGTGNTDNIADFNEDAGKGDGEISVEELAEEEERGGRRGSTPKSQAQSEGAASEVRRIDPKSLSKEELDRLLGYTTKPKDEDAPVAKAPVTPEVTPKAEAPKAQQVKETAQKRAPKAKPLFSVENMTGEAKPAPAAPAPMKIGTLEEAAPTWRSGKDAAEWLADNATDPDYRIIASRILPALQNSLFYVFTANQAIRGSIARMLNTVAQGVYYRDLTNGERAIVIREDKLGEEVILHEIIHSAADDRIEQGARGAMKDTPLGKAVSEYLTLWKEVAAAFKQRAKQNPALMDDIQLVMAVSDARELMTYGLTNRRVQEFLKSVTVTGNKSAWSQFVTSLRKILGLQESQQDALTRLMDLSEQIWATDAPLETSPVADITKPPKPKTSEKSAKSADERVSKSIDYDAERWNDSSWEEVHRQYFRDVMDALGEHVYSKTLDHSYRKQALFDDTFTPERHFASLKVKGDVMFEELSEEEFQKALAKGNSAFDELQSRVQKEISLTMYEQIRKLTKDVSVYYLPDEDFDRFSPKATAYYNVNGDYVVMRDSLFEPRNKNRHMHVLVHEMSHAAFVHVVKQSPILQKQLKRLLTKVKAHAAKTGWAGDQYGFTNIDEMIAETWSNPEFQEFMATVPIGSVDKALLGVTSSKIRNALDWVREKIVTAFGVPSPTKWTGMNPDSAFDVMMAIADRMLDAAPKARRRFYETQNPDMAPLEVFAAEQVTPEGNKPKREPGIAQRMKKRGLNDRQAQRVAQLIRERYGNKATDEQLDQIAALIRGEGDAAERAAKVAKAEATRAEAAMKRLGREVDAAIEEEFVPGKNPGRPWLLWGKTTTAVARIGDRFFGENNPLREVASIIQRRDRIRDQYRQDMMHAVRDLLAIKGKFPTKVVDDFFELIHDVTMAGVHPDVGLDHEKNAHLGKDALKGMYGKGAHPELKARYDALPQELKDLYARTRDTLTDAQNQMTYGLMRNTLSALGFNDEAMVRRFHEGRATETDYAMVGEEAAQHLINATAMRKVEGPYFNLVRRGDHVVRGTYKVTPPGNATVLEPNVFEFKSRKEAIAYVQKMAQTDKLKATIQSVWVDKNTGQLTAIDVDGKEVKISPKDVDAENRFRVTVQNEHVEFVDGRREALRRNKALKAAGLEMRDIEAVQWERDAQNAQMLSDQFRALAATIDKRDSTSKLTGAQKAELKGLMNEVSLRFLGATRIQSSRLPRRYVQGASRDIARNTYDYVRETAGYLAKLDTEPQMEAAIKDMDDRLKSLSAKGTGAGEGARLLVNEIKERALDPNYGQGKDSMLRAIGDRLLLLSFLRHLVSPAYSFVNMLGGSFMTFSHLAGDFNPFTANYQMVKAYRDMGVVGTTLRGVGNTLVAVTGKDMSEIDFFASIKKRLKGRELEMLERLDAENLLASGAAMDLDRVFDKSNNIVGRSFDAVTGYAENIGRVMPQAVEAVNRTMTALAAYRMQFAKTKDHEKAIRYAIDAVDKTQGNYAASNAPPVFNAPFLRVALQFKKYPQLVYTFLFENVARTLRPMQKGDRRKGVMSLLYTAATMQVFAGTVGLPFLEAGKLIVTLLAAAGLDDDDWEDWKAWYEKLIADMTGSEKASEMVTYGVTRGLGDWGFDLSGRVGMGDMLVYGEPRSGKESDVKTWLFDLLGGPAVGYAGDIVSGMADVIDGDIAKGMGKIVPMKVLADLGKAVTGADSGSMDTEDAVLRVLGLTSADQARANTEKWRGIKDKQQARAVVGELIGDLLSARSTEEIRDAVRAIEQHNAKLGKDDPSYITGLKGLLVKRKAEAAKERQAANQ